MLSFLTASVLRDLSFRTRLRRRPHTINADSLASLHSTQLDRLTLTFFFPRSNKCNRDAVSSLIVGGARILVEFAFAPPPATAGRQYRNAWRNLRRATARSTSSASQRLRAKSRAPSSSLSWRWLWPAASGHPNNRPHAKKHSPCIASSS